MIEKFLAKFNEFSSKEEIKDLSNEAKVTLFALYVQTCKPSGTNVATNEPQRSGAKPATYKQIKFIKQLIGEGSLDQAININNLTLVEASKLITQGVKSKENSGTFKGAYNHQSGNLESQASFWD